MKYLTIDTTTKITALSLGEEGKLISEGFLHTRKTHSERLIPMLEQLLIAADWELKDLDFIGVVNGPGSFTGIRIGISTAQGLSQVLKIPMIGIGSLDTLSWAGWGRKEDTVVILDARKNEWYSARYSWKDNRECLEPPKAASPEDLMIELTKLDKEFIFVGDAVPGAKEYLQKTLGEKAIIPLEYQYLPRGAYAAYEAWEKWNNKDITTDNYKVVEPCYLRLSEAEVNFKKKNVVN
ncbi:MAG: tRNA threonylcarbamoyladenosine biosynthesis protein TsaB [Gracilibacter sp. BRH_c7a]|nr:MAG: tRNA threonylcarbamoyladenosine biosynthesis protein TsaB [Gracilibacter sp. BRH_c7a]